MAITVKIKNMAQIQSAFRSSPVEMTKQLNNAIRLSLFDIEAQSKRNTPVRTGQLRASHTTAFSSLRGELEPKANYARYVHDGTYKMRARPFLLNAVKNKERSVDKNFEGAVQNVLDKIAKDIN